MALHNHAESHLFNIPLKNEIKYLGIVITKDPKIREKRNLIENMKKSQNILHMWVQRDISIYGRIIIQKSEALSRLIYPAFSLSLSDSWIKDINQIQYKNKHHYIRKSDVKPISEGGMNVIDFDVMNGTLKLRWLQAFLRNKHSVWFSISSKMFDSLGGIDLLLRCDFEPLKLNCKLSSFHSQVLLYWKLLYKHNFSPHSCSLWNNKYILMKCFFRTVWTKVSGPLCTLWMGMDICLVMMIFVKNTILFVRRIYTCLCWKLFLLVWFSWLKVYCVIHLWYQD